MQLPATKQEQNLWQSLEEATADPESANLTHLWQELEKTLEGLPTEVQLQKLGQAIKQMAEILARRSTLLLTTWEEAHSNSGPVVREEAIAEFVRQTMALDLSNLVDSSATIGPGRKQLEPDTSLAGDVDKRALLKVIENIETADSQAQAVQASLEKAHSEDIAQWVEAIAQWMKCQGKGEVISLVQLQQALRMPLVEVWLGLLHSPEASYTLEQQSEFYDQNGIWLC